MPWCNTELGGRETKRTNGRQFGGVEKEGKGESGRGEKAKKHILKI